MEVYLRDTKKRTYLNPEVNGRFSFVKDASKAHVYDEVVAKNIVNHNMSAIQRARTKLISVDKVRQQAKKTACKPTAAKQNRVQDSVHDKPSHTESTYRCNDIVMKAKEELERELSRVDKQLSDIYHLILIEKPLPAHKGYLMYKKEKEILEERSQIKLRLGSLYEVLGREHTQYNPRTDIYDDIKRLLDGS